MPRRVIPAGTARLGTPDDVLPRAMDACREAGSRRCSERRFGAEQPSLEVQVSSFALDQHEVTRAQYQRCVDMGACAAIDERECSIYDGESWATGRELAPASRDEHDPRTCVTRAEASSYCVWAGARLPTEAEWSRGAGTSVFAWGDTWDAARVNYIESHYPPQLEGPDSRPEGMSWSGAAHMSGNAYEWVAGGGCDYGDFPTGPDPVCPDDGERGVVRGGSFVSDGGGVRVNYRRIAALDTRSSSYGFRCVGAVPEAVAAAGERQDFCMVVRELQDEGRRAALDPFGDVSAMIDLDRFGEPFGSCVPSDTGAWGFVIAELDVEGGEDDEPYELDEMALSWSLVFVDSTGIVAQTRRARLEYSSDSPEESVEVISGGDIDGDGVPELQYRVISDWYWGTEHEDRLVTVSAGQVTDFQLPQGLSRLGLERIADVDADGIADLVVRTGDARLPDCRDYDPGDEDIYHPLEYPFLAHGRGDGLFTLVDETALAFARQTCGEFEAPPLLADTGHSRFAVCVPVFGLDPEPWLDSLRSDCEWLEISEPDGCHPVCRGLGRLDGLARQAHPLGGNTPFDRGREGQPAVDGSLASEGSADTPAIETLVVSTAEQLRAAIGSHRRIEIASGRPLRFDEALVIDGVEALTITSESNDTPATLLQTDPDELVIGVYDSSAVTLSRLTIGHEVETTCETSTVSVDRSDHIHIDSCRVYGSGRIGLEILLSSNVAMTGGEIYGCSDAAVVIDSSTHAHLNGVAIHDNPANSDLLQVRASNSVRFFDVWITENVSPASERHFERPLLLRTIDSDVELADVEQHDNTGFNTSGIPSSEDWD